VLAAGILLGLGGVRAWAAPLVKQIGADLYAYISDNDASANSTFLVGGKSILVVDTGLNATEGRKLLHAIRGISQLPVGYIINTHYHPDHQGGNGVLGPGAVIISTGWTRDRTLPLLKSHVVEGAQFRPADITFEDKLTLHLDPYIADVYFPGKAHTSGDALVYFPQQRAIAMGDLFLNRSSPAMDQGSAATWIQALDRVLQLPISAAVPGHFELGSKDDLRRFRNYLSDLYGQVAVLYRQGASLEKVRGSLQMGAYKDFRQYPKYEATFEDNAATIYKQMRSTGEQ
jgi:cyclase